MTSFNLPTFDLSTIPTPPPRPHLDQATLEAQLGLSCIPSDQAHRPSDPPTNPCDHAPLPADAFWPPPEDEYDPNTLLPLLAAPDNPTPAPLTVATAPPQPALTAAISSSTAGSATDGLSAVDRAKRRAEDYTMSQLSKKRRMTAQMLAEGKRRKGSAGSSCSDDPWQQDQNAAPETESHRKYQKRLQKNRDSAFVSRIRRREYTRVLEESLLTVEKEKEAAVANFLEMKQKYEIANAELSGIKHAARANMSGLGDSNMGGVSRIEPMHHAGPVVPAGPTHVLPARRPDSSRHPARPGTAVTMFMFAFMVGAVLPKFGRESGMGIGIGGGLSGGQLIGRIARNVAKGRFRFAGMGLPGTGMEKRKGEVWGFGQQGGERVVLKGSVRLFAEVRREGERVLGEEWERVSGTVERYLEELLEREVDELEMLLRERCAGNGVERLKVVVGRALEWAGKEQKVLDQVVRRLEGLTIA